MSDQYGWFRHLPHEALLECLGEVIKAAKGEQPTESLDSVLASWQATAEVYADPKLYKVLTEDSCGDLGPVERQKEK